MQRIRLIRIVAVATLSLVVNEGRAMAQDETRNAPAVGSNAARPLLLLLSGAYDGDFVHGDTSFFGWQSGAPGHSSNGAKSHDYRELSDFFNVREANVNTVAGEWELELEGEWFTGAGGDDDFEFTPNLKYGLNDDLFIEVEVLPLTLGDGGDQGNGDISLQLFNQFTRETDTLPAFAAWVEARFPTGQGSSKIDGKLHVNLTKTLITDVRGHMEGFVETANGGRGDEDANRRSFQWGAGIGIDYQIDDLTICMVNYLNRSSEAYGNSNQQILEIGGVRQIAENQHLKFAVDIGLDGHDETPDFGAKVLWSLEW